MKHQNRLLSGLITGSKHIVFGTLILVASTLTAWNQQVDLPNPSVTNGVPRSETIETAGSRGNLAFGKSDSHTPMTKV